MSKFQFAFCILLFFLFTGQLVSQTVSDTLGMARNLKAQGKLNDASNLLEIWCQIHPQQTDALWLYAQNEYWLKNFDKSKKLYREAISIQSDNLYLKLDFVETLLNMGLISKAEELLHNLSRIEKRDPYAMYVQANLYYWKGNLKEAQKLARAAKKSGSKEALNLLGEIEKLQAPWMQIGINYSQDTQPLKSIEPILEAGTFFSKWLDLRFCLSPQHFFSDSLTANVTRFEIANQFHFFNTGTQLGLKLGFSNQKNHKTEITGGIEIEQQLATGLQLHVDATQKPYLYTRASVDTNILFHQISVDLGWKESHDIWVKTGLQLDVFKDNNRITTYWGWAYTPAIKFKTISARIGYSYSISNADESRYYSIKSLNDILNSSDPTAPINGAYTSYFTPRKMEIHAALAMLDIQISKRILLSAKGKYGFIASAQNPYLYLSSDSNSTIFIQRDFHKTNFKPFDINANLIIQLSDQLSILGSYTFSRIFFYDLQTASGRLKILF